jgi:tRNA(fMet)-specific endonuclease VapC
MRYMLDTNICIYTIKHKPEKVFQRLQEIDPEDICVSSVTYAELVHGVEKSAAVEKNRLALLMLLAKMLFICQMLVITIVLSQMMILKL